MKTIPIILIPVVILLVAGRLPTRAQGTAFAYQGFLDNPGAPSNLVYDLRFTLHDAVSGGSQVAGPVTNTAVTPSNGLFTVYLDFGSAPFDGGERWLELGYRTNGVPGDFSVLGPRQPVTPTPYALFAATAATTPAGAIGSNELAADSVTSVKIASGQVVRSLNALRDDVQIEAGANIALMTNGNALQISATTNVTGGASWGVSGNSGTAAGVNFMGTTDDEPLELHVNSQRALRLEPTAVSGRPNAVLGSSDNGIEATTFSSTIGGGAVNRIQAGLFAATISGGQANTNASSAGTIGGGSQNEVEGSAEGSVIAGGSFNRIGSGAGHSTVGGGELQVVQSGADFATVGGGFENLIASNALSATISGGFQNTNSAQYASIGGGHLNLSSGSSATVGGGEFNSASQNYATVGGGFSNTSADQYGTIGGGWRNVVAGTYATVGGGAFNTASNSYVTIGGGSLNSAEGLYATVGGGNANKAKVYLATIGGGLTNVANSLASTIAGGYANFAGGAYAMIPGGSSNSAAGQYSFAAGRRAKANHSGTFVWADATDADFASTDSNQVCIRAAGGVQLNTDTSMYFGSQTRQMINLWGSLYAIGVQTDTLYMRSDTGFAWFRDGIHSDTQNDPGTGGTLLMRLDDNGDLYTTGTVNPPSDRNLKQNFEEIDAMKVLQEVLKLPLQTWGYKSAPEVRHLGPVAQDFHAAFRLGADDKHIATVDADGVALAAIQGLNQKVEGRIQSAELSIRNTEVRIQELAAENADLKRRNADLETRLSALEQLLTRVRGAHLNNQRSNPRREQQP